LTDVPNDEHLAHVLQRLRACPPKIRYSKLWPTRGSRVGL
jgi:hypothetical protein